MECCWSTVSQSPRYAYCKEVTDKSAQHQHPQCQQLYNFVNERRARALQPASTGVLQPFDASVENANWSQAAVKVDRVEGPNLLVVRTSPVRGIKVAIPNYLPTFCRRESGVNSALTHYVPYGNRIELLLGPCFHTLEL